MKPRHSVVITGLGIVSPIGIGADACWSSIVEGRSGIGPLSAVACNDFPVSVAGEVRNFDPKEHVRPRKSLKVMARDTQLGVVAAQMAREDARLEAGAVDPERIGVLVGADPIRAQIEDTINCYTASIEDGSFLMSRWGPRALPVSFPLEMLRMLPNMIASHVSIIQDARGPINATHLGELSGLLAIGEAARIIERGAADVMLAGGASSRMHPYDFIRFFMNHELVGHSDDPASACRPFDLNRGGLVRSEGAAMLVLESLEHAERRGATIYARVAGWATAYGAPKTGQAADSGIARAIRAALADAEREPSDIGFVSSAAEGTRIGDAYEARALEAAMPHVPVTALKSYLGSSYAASGALELALSLIGLRRALVPPTLNYHTPDPECPVDVVAGAPRELGATSAVVVGRTEQGQAGAAVLVRD